MKYFSQAAVSSERPAGEHRQQLQQGGGEDESERGGVAVEDPQQLRLACPGIWFPNFGALVARGSWRNQRAPAQYETEI